MSGGINRYEEALGILEKDYPNGKEAIAYIKVIDPRKFSRYALVLPRYGRVTSNAMECMNAAFLKLQEYAARRLLFEVRIYVMRSFYERQTTTEGSIDLLTEYAKGQLSEFEREYGSQAIPPVTEQDLVIHITCRAPEAAVRRGRARTVRIPNGGGNSRRHKEYMYPVQDEARLISSQDPLTAISDQAAGPSTQDGRGKSQCSVNRVHVDPIIRVYRGRPKTTRVDLLCETKDASRETLRAAVCLRSEK
ncbi:hypothetical protein R1flu_016308 [Riccia fluitans]|uniref:Uncharacterized protein n=1 Tax=Riccia fluitans TaxID=41844 RepID=A0ABD1YLH3_9MARC